MRKRNFQLNSSDGESEDSKNHYAESTSELLRALLLYSTLHALKAMF